MPETKIHMLFINPHVLWDVTIVFLFITAVVIVYMSLYMYRRSRRKNNHGSWKNSFAEFIGELAIIESNDELEQLLAQQKSIMLLINRNTNARKLMGRQLLRASKQLSGNAHMNIVRFYNLCDLGADSLRRLKRGQWFVKAAAMQELSQLDQRKYITQIYRYTDHADELVRSEARIAVVKLTGVAGLRFLDIISRPLSEWEQLGLLHELSRTAPTEFPCLNKWLLSGNNSVVEFALRLVRIYRLNVPKDVLEKCVIHPHKPIRHGAILAAAEIPDPAITDLLLNRFEVEISVDLQLLLLQALQINTTGFSLSFLMDGLRHPDATLKLAIARIIRDNEPEAWADLPNMVNASDYPWNQIIPLLENENAA